MKKIDFMITAFRDGFQSVYGTRVFAKDYMPAVESAVEAGITHFESGGGAMFQAPFFYANENAFDNMDTFRRVVGPNANLQTLARGVNVVGLESQSSDIINLHAKMFKKHGITTIRNFDALNDINNLIFSGKCIKDAGLKHEVAITMMSLAPGWDKTGKVHTPEFYVSILKQILDAGISFDSVCFKDASGTSTPSTVHKTIALARKMLPEGTKIVFHTHETAGTSIACYLEAIAAGVSSIDLSLAPVSGGTCSPDISTMWHALRGTDFTLDIDIKKIMETEKLFQQCMQDYPLPPESKAVDPRIPFSPLPGGALTANTQMLRDNGILDKYNDVVEAMGECVRLGGFGTSVTPVSQFYFQQAFNNVMFGPWKKFAEGYGKMILGYFGKTPVEPDPQIVKLASEQMKLEPASKTVLEINDANPKKGIRPATEKLKAANLPVTDENIFIAAACGDKGIDFLQGKAKVSIPKKKKENLSAAGKNTCNLNIEGQFYSVTLDGNKATVNGKTYNFSESDAQLPPTNNVSPLGKSAVIKAPLPGAVVKLLAKDGDCVQKDQSIITLEAMKMETEVKAVSSGIVHFKIKAGDKISAGDILAEIN
ncbi:MAG: biotin attachment protein [Elusimicrobiota bacterium]|jgi:pyruvate carboxylase subunit B|nr:biotin attachment protein [Elusimicrobiota bacterium]